MHRTDSTAQAIDDALAGTFPASDPPSWTPGMARPIPETVGRDSETDRARTEQTIQTVRCSRLQTIRR